MKSRKPRKKARNYRQEYDSFHSKPVQIQRRTMRNKARKMLGLKKGDPREVDHVIPLSRGGTNARSNIRAVSRSTNRKKAASAGKSKTKRKQGSY